VIRIQNCCFRIALIWIVASIVPISNFKCQTEFQNCERTFSGNKRFRFLVLLIDQIRPTARDSLDCNVSVVTMQVLYSTSLICAVISVLRTPRIIFLLRQQTMAMSRSDIERGTKLPCLRSCLKHTFNSKQRVLIPFWLSSVGFLIISALKLGTNQIVGRDALVTIGFCLGMSCGGLGAGPFFVLWVKSVMSPMLKSASASAEQKIAETTAAETETATAQNAVEEQHRARTQLTIRFMRLWLLGSTALAVLGGFAPLVLLAFDASDATAQNAAFAVYEGGISLLMIAMTFVTIYFGGQLASQIRESCIAFFLLFQS